MTTSFGEGNNLQTLSSNSGQSLNSWKLKNNIVIYLQLLDLLPVK